MATDVITSAIGSGSVNNGSIVVFNPIDPIERSPDLNSSIPSGDLQSSLDDRNDDVGYYHGKTRWVENEDAATIEFNLNKSNVHQVILGGNRTLSVTNTYPGQRFILRLQQDGTGSRTVTWFDNILWAGGSAPTLTTTADKADLIGFMATSGGWYDGLVVGQNI